MFRIMLTVKSFLYTALLTDLSNGSKHFFCVTYNWGRESVVGIATRYGLDGPGIESRWGRDFPHPSRPALGPPKPPV